MNYRTISMIVTNPAVDRAALACAAAIAEADQSHLDLHCLGVDPSRYDPIAPGATALVLDAGVAEAKESAAACQAWAEGLVPATLTSVSYDQTVVPQLGLDTAVSRLVRYSDLIVATKPYGRERDPTPVQVLEAALFGTGAPVLVIPPEYEGPSWPFRRVAVAWNESEESFDAVRAALPLLTAAQTVDILLVDPPSHSPERSDPGGQICLMLARHGVRAEVHILARTLPRVADVLARFVKEHDCEALVMGAYGHSRLREAVLGGTTRDTLEMAEVPLLMSR